VTLTTLRAASAITVMPVRAIAATRARREGLAAGAVVTLIGLGLASTVRFETALGWDGSYYLFKLLKWQWPFTPYHRVAAVPLQWLVILASHITANVTVLALVFGGVYAAMPLGATAIAAWVAWRRAPRLLVWPALGIGIAALPGQMFMTSEAQLAILLAWPFLLITSLGRDRIEAATALVLGLALFFLHPVAIPLFVVAAGLAGAVGLVARSRRPVLWLWATVLLVVTPLRFAMIEPGYESSAFSFKNVAQLAHGGLRPLVVASLALGCAAGLLVLVAGSLTSYRWRLMAGVASVLLLFGAAALLMEWGRTRSSWAVEEDYRAFVFFASVPFMAMFGIEAVAAARANRHGRSPTLDGPRTAASLLATLIFAAVLIVQGTEWQELRGTLQARLASATSPCLSPQSAMGPPPTALHQPATALYHWATPSLAIVLQGRHPRHFVLSDADCRRLVRNGELRIAFWDTEDTHRGWFVFPPPA
jgi:hypothetical protein